MRYLYGFIVLLVFSTATSAEIQEIKIEPQDVMVWNSVDPDVLGIISADMERWCKKDDMGPCPINSVSTFLSVNRSHVFYLVDMKYIDDVAVVYVLDSEVPAKFAGKSWVSTWEPVILKRLPFVPIPD